MRHHICINFTPNELSEPITIFIYHTSIKIKPNEIDYLCTIYGSEDMGWIKCANFVVRKSQTGDSTVVTLLPNPLGENEDISDFTGKLLAALEK